VTLQAKNFLKIFGQFLQFFSKLYTFSIFTSLCHLCISKSSFSFLCFGTSMQMITNNSLLSLTLLIAYVTLIKMYY